MMKTYRNTFYTLIFLLITALICIMPASAGPVQVNSAFLFDNGFELKSGNYVLCEDISLPKTLVVASPGVKLDLNGCTLALTEDTEHVISIIEYGDLTLSDSKNTGKITGLKNSNGDKIGEYGGGVYILSGKFVMNGGTIYECTAHEGGAVYVAPGSEFIMNGGSIDSCYGVQGAGIYNDAEGYVQINGGSIVNTGKSLKYDSSTLDYKAQFGGAAYNAGYMEINSCTITNCRAKQGGGIYNAAQRETYTILKINGGVFKDGLTDFHNGGDDLYTTASVPISGGTLENTVFVKEAEILLSGSGLILGEITLVGSTLYTADSWIGYKRPGCTFDGWYRNYMNEYFLLDDQQKGPWHYHAESDKIIARWSGSGAAAAPQKTSTPVKTAVPTPDTVIETATPVKTATPAPTVIETVQPTVMQTEEPGPAVTMTKEPLPTFTLAPVQTDPRIPETPFPLAGILAGCAAALFVCRRHK
ncbi:MAG TPA: hypothetical protein O0X39_00915 [Methanocorpusculum sp.]|nr:hypothetical protein [Methanocorpusculum sp.]